MADHVETGCLALVLHAHLPFVRHPEHEDSLEENWLFEAITESYLPLLMAMDRLVAEQIDFRLTFSLTPTLVAMLQDEFLLSRYERRLARLHELAGKEVRRTRKHPELQAVAAFYDHRLAEVYGAFVGRYRRDLVAAFARLQNLGRVEILASAATHGYLPLLAVNPGAVRRQVQIGVEDYRRVFGRAPAGFWLPECGYGPGVDEELARYGIRYTILEAHGITRASPPPAHGVYTPLRCSSGVAVFGRDPDSSRQVWSSTEGYPGDPDYREFYRDIAYDLDHEYVRPYIHRDGIRIDTGLKYYRITGTTEHKEVYVPERAEAKARLHAVNFLECRRRQSEHLASVMKTAPIIVAPYDAELFGHWWFEGPLWIEALLRQAAEQREVRLVTLSEYLQERPQLPAATPAISSWGYKGFHEMWLNGKTDWMYPHLHRAAAILERLEERYAAADGLLRRALDQARRELLLAQASDWAFMISSGTTVGYARERAQSHLLRVEKLRLALENGPIDAAWLEAIEKQDPIFPASVIGAGS